MANMQGLPSLQEQAIAKHPPIPAPKGSELPYDLAQMLAKQKVLKAAIDAEAQRMLQQSQGQGGKPPTVDPTVDESLNQKLAQLLAPPQQQAGPDLQQAALGPGMNNQGAAPPNGGAIPQPQQAPQAMAAGGLARLPSNLPQSYAGGGIIAFDEGGTAKRYRSSLDDAINAEAAARVKPDSDWDSKWAVLKAMGIDIGSLFDLKEGTTGQATKDAIAKLNNPNYSNEGEPASTPAPTAAPEAPWVDAPASVRPDVAPSVAPSAAPPRDKRPSVAQGSGSAPAASTGFGLGDLSSKLLGRVNAGVGEDPATAERDITARYSAAVGDKEKALRQLQNENIQRQQAADEAQLKAADPNSWGRWLSRFDPHSRFLGEGVAAKTYAEQDAYQAMKQKQLAGLRALQEAQATGELGDVKGRFELGDKERTAAEARRAGYTKDATTLFDTGATNASNERIAKLRAEAMAEAASIRAEAKTKDEFKGLIDAKIKIELGQLAEFKGKAYLSEPDKAKKAAIEARIQGLNDALNQHDPRLVAGATTPTSTTLSPAQEARRKAILEGK